MLNPLVSKNPEAINIFPLMYNVLTHYNNITGEVRNVLVEEVAWQESNEILEMKLKQNVRFHNGRLLTPREIIYSIEKYKEGMVDSPIYIYFNNIEKVESINNEKIRLTLRKSNASGVFFLNFLYITQEIKENLALCEIGTGPFRLVRREKNIIFFERNDEYFGKSPAIDEIQVVEYENYSQLWAALIKEEINLSYYLLAEDYNILKGNPYFNCYKYLSPMCHIIVFNVEKELFSDKKVRIALNLAIDKQAIINQCLDGIGEVCESSIYPKSWAHEKNLKGFEYDPEKALQILNECGWVDKDQDGILEKGDKEFSFTVLIDKGDTLKKMVAQHVSLYLTEIGVQMNCKFTERQELIGKFLMPGDFEAVFAQFLTLEPDINYIFWHSSQIDSGFNCFGYRNSEVDQALEEGRRSFDREKRKNAYSRFQQAFLDDPPGIFLFYPYHFVVANKKIEGIQPSPYDILGNIEQWDIRQ